MDGQTGSGQPGPVNSGDADGAAAKASEIVSSKLFNDLDSGGSVAKSMIFEVLKVTTEYTIDSVIQTVERQSGLVDFEQKQAQAGNQLGSGSEPAVALNAGSSGDSAASGSSGSSLELAESSKLATAISVGKRVNSTLKRLDIDPADLAKWIAKPQNASAAASAAAAGGAAFMAARELRKRRKLVLEQRRLIQLEMQTSATTTAETSSTVAPSSDDNQDSSDEIVIDAIVVEEDEF